MLFKTTEAFHRLSWGVVLPAVGGTVAWFAFAVGKGLAAQRLRRVSGRDGLVGERGRVLGTLGPQRAGKVFVHGEYWNARAEGEIQGGAEVEVLGIEGMELRVGPVGSERRE